MNTTTQDTEPNVPALIVFGIPSKGTTPQAAWYRASQVERARQAAQQQGFTAIPVDSDDTRAIAATLNEGQLKAGGQLALSIVPHDVLERLRALTAGTGIPMGLWHLLKVTDTVLAADLINGEPDAWYEAVIIKIEDGVFTLRWTYAPEEPLFKLKRQHIALMFPN
jgi:hypothetical protein